MRTSRPRSRLGLAAALAIAVASPALLVPDRTAGAEPAGNTLDAIHLRALPWRAPWAPANVAEAYSSPAPWEVGAPWLTPAYRSGLLIAIDPATRRPTRPTPEQRRAFSDLFGADAVTPDLPAERLPRGGEIVHLNGRFQVFSVARRDASGRLVLDCVSDPDQAARPAGASANPRPTVASPTARPRAEVR